MGLKDPIFLCLNYFAGGSERYLLMRKGEYLSPAKAEDLVRFGLPLATVGFLFIVSLGAFSRKTKREIHERDGWVCVGCGSSHPLEASHFNHDRSHPDYDKASNGDTRCPSCHLEQHIENAGNNGLCREAND